MLAPTESNEPRNAFLASAVLWALDAGDLGEAGGADRSDVVDISTFAILALQEGVR